MVHEGSIRVYDFGAEREMMSSFRVTVQPSVLKWAREAVQLTESDAARKVGVSPERLQSWENGTSSPTFRQLQTMAEKYRRPVAILYLQTPPEHVDTLKQFRRSLESAGVELPYELVSGIERVRMQQNVMSEIYELDDMRPPSFGLTLDLEMGVEASATTLRDWLGLTGDQQRRWAKSGELFVRLSELIEARGILVTQIQRVPVSVMRGCALSDHTFPAIVINGADAKTAKAFTLIHEVVHILLRVHEQTRVVPVTIQTPKTETETELFCNRVAAAALMPRDDLLRHHTVAFRPRSVSWDMNQLQSISEEFGVSPEVALRRLITLEQATWEDYSALRAAFSIRQARSSVSENSPLYYPLKVRDLGKRYISDVVAAYDRRDLNASDLAEYLEIKVNKLPRLLNQMAGRSS